MWRPYPTPENLFPEPGSRSNGRVWGGIMKKSLLVLISSCCLWLLNGCGSGSSTQTQDVATHFSIMAATSTPTAGKAFNITVTALDATGQMVATYSGTVQLTSSNGQAVQPASETLPSGTGRFSRPLTTGGTQSIPAPAPPLPGKPGPLPASARWPRSFRLTLLP